jgi:hypothetical protein
MNCLRKGHSVDKRNGGSCGICKKRSHHSKLHLENHFPLPNASSNPISKFELSPTSREFTPPETKQQLSFKVEDFNETNLKNGHVFLATAVVLVQGDFKGKFVKCRILLDNCSQLNFMTESFSSKLRLKRSSINASVRGIAESILKIKHKMNITFKSTVADYLLE